MSKTTHFKKTDDGFKKVKRVGKKYHKTNNNVVIPVGRSTRVDASLMAQYS